jgi:transcriptional regulator with XRE-family HTH domain
LQPLTTAEDEWEPPPTTRSHAELVAEVKEHMATLGLTQKQFAQRVAGRRLRQVYVSHWLKLCGGQLKVHTISSIDRRVAAYLDDPEGVSARFLKADEAGAAPAKWEPPPTSREHSELVQAIQEHIVTQRYTQAQLGARMGKNASTMSQWLLGKVPPGPCAKLDARAAAYLADPEGVAARCAADAAAADAAAAAAAAREVQKREAEARALAARVGHKRKAAPPDRFSPPRIGDSRAPRATLHHDDWCFSCGDGGEIIECTVCPRSYHLSCVHLTEVPKGSWYCPWHACWECARKSTDVGGQLFHCMTCPLTYCFDCAPDAYTEGNAVRTAEATATAAMLEQRGIQSTKSYLFFHCDDCKTERRKPPVPVTLKRARAATEAGPTVGDEAAPAEGGAGGAEGGSDAGVPDVVELANLKAAWRYELDGTQVRVEQHEFHRLEKGVQLTDSGKGFTRDFASAIFSDVEVLETRQQESAKWLQSMNKKLKEPNPQSYKGEWQLRLERSSAGVASEAELSQKVHAARSEAGVAQHAMMEASATEAAAVPLAPLDELLEKGTLRREDEPTAAPEPKKPRTSIGLADADSPERSEKLLASLAEYLETCGGSAEMIIGWYTKTGWYNKQGATEGTTYSYFINTQVSRIAAPSWAHSRAEPCR